MSTPLISIVTPSYNQAEFLEETILSVINQNYPNLEYIVIDGGSTDGSVDIIKKYAHHFTYWISEPDRGHADALNKGFAKATGEIMAWINSDDKYFPWTFNTIAEIYTEHPDILWTTGLHSNFNRKGVLMAGTSNVRADYKNIYNYIFRQLHIQQESVFWRRSLWLLSGAYIDEQVHLMVDTELWCRFFLQTELWHIDQVIGGYRTYGLNRSHNYDEFVKEDIDNSIKKLIANLPPEKKIVLTQIKEYNINYEHNNKIAEAVAFQIRTNKILQLLPYVMYDKICNYLFFRLMKNKDSKPLVLPSDPSLVYKKLVRSETGWMKVELPFNIPY